MRPHSGLHPARAAGLLLVVALAVAALLLVAVAVAAAMAVVAGLVRPLAVVPSASSTCGARASSGGAPLKVEGAQQPYCLVTCRVLGRALVAAARRRSGTGNRSAFRLRHRRVICPKSLPCKRVAKRNLSLTKGRLRVLWATIARTSANLPMSTRSIDGSAPEEPSLRPELEMNPNSVSINGSAKTVYARQVSRGNLTARLEVRSNAASDEERRSRSGSVITVDKAKKLVRGIDMLGDGELKPKTVGGALATLCAFLALLIYSLVRINEFKNSPLPMETVARCTIADGPVLPGPLFPMTVLCIAPSGCSLELVYSVSAHRDPISIYCCAACIPLAQAPNHFDSHA